jgi:hypothetical protein
MNRGRVRLLVAVAVVLSPPYAFSDIECKVKADTMITQPGSFERAVTLVNHGKSNQYLFAEGAKDIREPVLWLTTGGEVLGRNEFGEVRYLAPDPAALLAKAFADESPDELGHGVYDEAEMDTAGVYPRFWERLVRTYDPLGKLRELFSYARTFHEALSPGSQG